jgi:hypothetical protein
VIVIYLDTGCLVKLYYPEPNSAALIAVVGEQPIWYTPLHELEFVNALSLKVFLKTATGCRSLDILHCAAAKVISASVFITTDVRQKSLAAAMRLDLIAF